MSALEERILTALAKPSYQPLKPKALARRLNLPDVEYSQFRKVLKEMLQQGRIEMGKNHTVRQAQPHGTVTGVFRKIGSGAGFVRPAETTGNAPPDIHIRAEDTLDAASGDLVLVKLNRKAGAGARGIILQVVERATRQFVGTYFERDGEGYVRVDGTVFSHSIYVGDPGAKGARPEDKVVLEMLRFPGPEDRGEGVLVEILGPRGKPGVDTLSIVRSFGLPDRFPEDVLAEAREMAEAFRETDLSGREDFTEQVVITIDPADAHDFDDAVSVWQDPETQHWQLHVHIADVGYFAPAGGALDREAYKRGNSVYLPQLVLPMFPELISNSLASLQQGKIRYVKTVVLDYTPEGQVTATRFANGAIRARQRFAYEQVSALLTQLDAQSADTDRRPIRRSTRPSQADRLAVDETPDDRQAVGLGKTDYDPAVLAMLPRMRTLAMMLRQRRLQRGMLELDMPEAELEYDAEGKVSGAHFRAHDVSHQIIEEFMLAANEAVAQHLAALEVPFLRRIHPDPDPLKLKAFAEFARILGYKMPREADRFAMQRILRQSSEHPDRYAVHYALLRSLKQAVYSPRDEGHYALATPIYCHFTSPIRRYPDLLVHRQLDHWLHKKRAGRDATELVAIGQHCSKTERRADIAERELIKVKLLDYMSSRLGEKFAAIITGVADYGFYAQAETMPVEGLVHISTLTDDYYYFEEASHTLLGRKTKRRYRLGDKVQVAVVRVDLQRRLLDMRVVEGKRK